MEEKNLTGGKRVPLVCWGGGLILEKVAWEVFNEKATFEKILEGDEKEQCDIEEKNIPGKGNSQCKGPGVGGCSPCLRKNSRGMSNKECR